MTIALFAPSQALENQFYKTPKNIGRIMNRSLMVVLLALSASADAQPITLKCTYAIEVVSNGSVILESEDSGSRRPYPLRLYIDLKKDEFLLKAPDQPWRAYSGVKESTTEIKVDYFKKTDTSKIYGTFRLDRTTLDLVREVEQELPPIGGVSLPSMSTQFLHACALADFEIETQI
ncbi:hypothetical protein N9O79_01480 [Luminiphilus sp.]|nr:hypothetical protein [Luminiphilus sp.]